MHRENKTKMFMLALLAGFTGCTDADENQQGDSSQATSNTEVELTVVDPAAFVDAERFVVSNTSWGVAPNKPTRSKPEEPPIVISWKEGQRQKFEREAKTRWKNTEIFVRRDR